MRGLQVKKRNYIAEVRSVREMSAQGGKDGINGQEPIFP